MLDDTMGASCRSEETGDVSESVTNVVSSVRDRCLQMLWNINDCLAQKAKHEVPISDDTIGSRIGAIAVMTRDVLDDPRTSGRGSVDNVSRYMLARLFLAVIGEKAIHPLAIDPILEHLEVTSDKVSPGRLRLNRMRHSFNRSSAMQLMLRVEGKKGASHYYLDCDDGENEVEGVEGEVEDRFDLCELDMSEVVVDQKGRIVAQLESYISGMRSYKGSDFVFRALIEAASAMQPVRLVPWGRRMKEKVKRAANNLDKKGFKVKILFTNNGICWPYIESDDLNANELSKMLENFGQSGNDLSESGGDVSEGGEKEDRLEVVENPELEKRILDGVRHLAIGVASVSQIENTLRALYSFTIRGESVSLIELARACEVDRKVVTVMFLRIARYNEHFPTLLGFSVEKERTGGYRICLNDVYEKCDSNFSHVSSPIPVEINKHVEFDEEYFEELMRANNFFSAHADVLNVIAGFSRRGLAVSQLTIDNSLEENSRNLSGLKRLLREMDLGIELRKARFGTFYLKVKRPENILRGRELDEISNAVDLCASFLEKCDVELPNVFNLVKGESGRELCEKKVDLARVLIEILDPSFVLSRVQKIVIAMLGLTSLSGYTLSQDSCANVLEKEGKGRHYVGGLVSRFSRRMNIPLVIGRQFFAEDDGSRKVSYYVVPVDKEVYCGRELKLLSDFGKPHGSDVRRELVSNLLDAKNDIGVTSEVFGVIFDCFVDAVNAKASIDYLYVWNKAKEQGLEFAYNTIGSNFRELVEIIGSDSNYFGFVIERSDDSPLRYRPKLVDKEQPIPFESVEIERRLMKFARTRPVFQSRAHIDFICRYLFENTVRRRGRVNAQMVHEVASEAEIVFGDRFLIALIAEINRNSGEVGLKVDSLAGFYKIILLPNVVVPHDVVVGVDAPYSSDRYVDEMSFSYFERLKNSARNWFESAFVLERRREELSGVFDFILQNSINGRMVTNQDIRSFVEGNGGSVPRKTVGDWLRTMKNASSVEGVELREFGNKYFLVGSGYDNCLKKRHEQENVALEIAMKGYETVKKARAGTFDKEEARNLGGQIVLEGEKNRFDERCGKLRPFEDLSVHYCGFMTVAARSNREKGCIVMPYVDMFGEEMISSLEKTFPFEPRKEKFNYFTGWIKAFFLLYGDGLVSSNREMNVDLVAENFISFLYWRLRTDADLKQRFGFVLNILATRNDDVCVFVKRFFARKICGRK